MRQPAIYRFDGRHAGPDRSIAEALSEKLSIQSRELDSPDRNKLVLVDTHVHYYPFCTYSEFFEAGFGNMSDWARKLSQESGFTGVICLSETQKSNTFLELKDKAGIESDAGGWNIALVEGNDMLRAYRGPRQELLIIPGTQVVTAENLELLIIGSSQKIAGGRPAESYIDENDALFIVIPWGVGKWLGRRGKVIEDIITSGKQSSFAIGDNSGRPALWSYVPHFDLAAQRNISILPGSDPLPIAGQYGKVGGSGIAFHGSGNPDGLLDRLKRITLHAPESDFISYGKHDNFLQFMAAQLALRVNRL